MGADVPGAQPMRSAYLSLSVSTSEKAERIYTGAGGRWRGADEDGFFAYRFDQVRDRFGINWMVVHERPMPNA